MDRLLDYQKIIIQSTYERNGSEFVPSEGASLRAVLKQVRGDMSAFVEADQALLDSLLTMLDREAEGDESEEDAPAKLPSESRKHLFQERAFDQTDYCAVCEKFICAVGVQCQRCFFTVHTGCAAEAKQLCINLTSIRSNSHSQRSDATASPATTPVKKAPATPEDAVREKLYSAGNVYDLYERQGVLGKGGCGVVYKVVKKSNGEEFALKQMKKDAYLVEVLEREILIMKSYDHPGLTKLREAYCDEKFIYLIMDYIAGGELFDRIAELESFSEKDAADVTKQLLEALGYLHDQGCAHRDIKAENILLVSPDSTQVKIADFGLANTLGPRQKFLSFVGTTPYMAPEVLSGAHYTVGVDMWSLGVLVFVMLAGYMPFSGKTEMQEIRAILGGQYKFDQRRGWDKISAAAKNFISNLLLQDPDARFTAAQALAHPWIQGIALSQRKLSSLPSLNNLRDYQRESKRRSDDKKGEEKKKKKEKKSDKKEKKKEKKEEK